MSLQRADKFDEAWLAKRAPQKLKLLNFIRAEAKLGRPFPTFRLMADHMGWKNAGSAQESCQSLAYQYRALDAVMTANGRFTGFRLSDDAR